MNLVILAGKKYSHTLKSRTIAKKKKPDPEVFNVNIHYGTRPG